MALDDTAMDQSEKNKTSNSGSLIKRLLPLGVIAALLLAGYFSGVHTYLSPENLAQNKAALDAVSYTHLTLPTILLV